MPASSAQVRANNKFNAKKYDRIAVNVPKGKKSDLQSHAAIHGESLNGFINRAIDETVERDTNKNEGELT